MTLLTTGLAGTRPVGPGNEDYSGSHSIVLKAAAIHDSVKITRLSDISVLELIYEDQVSVLNLVVCDGIGRLSASDRFSGRLIRLRTLESELVGHSEAETQVGNRSSHQATGTISKQKLRPRRSSMRTYVMSRGRDVERCLRHYAIARGHVFLVLGHRGVMIFSIIGIDMAVGDVFGQLLGVPPTTISGTLNRKTECCRLLHGYSFRWHWPKNWSSVIHKVRHGGRPVNRIELANLTVRDVH